MDDVVITDVDKDGVPQSANEAVPKNQDLSSLGQIVGDFLPQHWWYILGFSVFIFVLIQQVSKRRSRNVASIVTKRQEAMEAARRKMQEELDAKAAIVKEKLKQQEEEKRRQKIEVWETMQQGKSYKRGTTFAQTPEEPSSSTAALKPKTNKKLLRSADYNPLSGHDGGSCSWRPGRRGPTSGG